MAEDVYCTLLMSDSYLPGAAVLAHSLRDSGTSKKLAVLVTLDSLLSDTISRLRDLYDYVLPVDKLANPSLENLYRLDRLDLRFAFTKIALWRQIQFRKIVYIDADAVALRAPDELFDLPFPFAAAPDVGWPDIFNSGVMLLTPSMSEYWSLHTLASSGTSFDGADQGLLNEYFGNRPWHRLSFTYNCTPNASYQYEPAYRHFRSSITMVHFIGKEKPWTQGREALSSSGSAIFKELLGRWWACYDRHYRISHVSNFQQVMNARVVKQYVKGEQPQEAFGWASAGATQDTSPPPPPPSVASPYSENGPREAEAAPTALLTENTFQQSHQPQAPFAPPPMAWDATRSEPPVESKPEARDFPSAHYEMSHDPGLFQPPKSYPEPPKDLHYQMPAAKSPVSEKPKPIFPWEETARKPTRVFADDPLPAHTEKSVSQPTALAMPAFSASGPVISASPTTPTVRIAPTDSFQEFSRTNAWDEVVSIDSYIRAVKQAQQARRAQIQVLHNDPTVGSTYTIGSPISPPTSATQRRESLILTDFPTEIERPSLPVTPAPIERSTFWGEERDAEGNLPPARGVPEQSEWDPTARLEELRRSSIIMAEGSPKGLEHEFPQREVPESSKGFGSSSPFSPVSQSSPIAAQGLGIGVGLQQSLTAQVEGTGAGPGPAQPKPPEIQALDEYSIA